MAKGTEGAPVVRRSDRDAIRPLLAVLCLGLVVGAGLIVLLKYGFPDPVLPVWLLRPVQVGALAGYWAIVHVASRKGRPVTPGREIGAPDLMLMAMVLVGALLELTLPGPGGWQVVELAIVGLFGAELWRLNLALSRTMDNPAILFPLSFVVMIAIGTVMIKTPASVPEGDRLGWIDAVFTMTSATCVTGLVVRDTATEFTAFGQTIIMVFIQLGALGFVIYGSTLALLLGGALSVREQRDLGELLTDHPVDRLASYTRFILVTLLSIQLVGALLMMPMWRSEGGESLTMAHRAGLSVFHSISAFCNAGSI